MPYDPDLDPVFDEFRSAQADHGAPFPITHDADEKAIRLHTLAFPMDKRVEHDSPPVPASRYDHPEADQGRGLRRRRRLADGGQDPWAPLLVACRLACRARLDGGEGQLDAMGAGNRYPGEVQLILEWRRHSLHHDLCPAYGKVGSNSRTGSFENEIKTDQWLGVTKPLDEEYHS